jgi:hypothetical protein
MSAQPAGSCTGTAILLCTDLVGSIVAEGLDMARESARLRLEQRLGTEA